jgi:hypothetical protein
MDKKKTIRKSARTALLPMKRATRMTCVQMSALRQSRISAQSANWLPDEPLAGVNSLASFDPEWSLDKLEKIDSKTTFKDLQTQCRSLYVENIRKKVEQILTFCVELNSDLVVFPEYSIPVEVIETLVKFSEQMLIVAGVGFVRESEQKIFKYHNLNPLPKNGNNVAVVLGPNVKSVVSKKHAADGETMIAGVGIEAFEIGGGVRAAVAICRDFLVDGSAQSSGASGPHVVAIPALSQAVDAFTNDAPRDFVRIFSNHSDLGGSAIHVPNLTFPAFVNNYGTLPFYTIL